MSYGRYIKLPVTVEAMRYFKSQEMVEKLLEFCNQHEKTAAFVIPHGQLGFNSGYLTLRTPEGMFYPKPGEWIIRDVDGYHFCSHETFRQNYSEVGSDG